MAVQKIVTNTHSTLRKKAKPVESVNQEIKDLLQDLLDTLDSKGDLGVGLSANQIDREWRMFVARIYPDGNSDPTDRPQVAPRHFINPEITARSKETNTSVDPEKRYLEGCLSLPDIYGFVERPLTVTVRFHTIETLENNEDQVEEEFTLDNSIVMQHEHDHLEGVLFTDHAMAQGHPLYEIKDGEEPRKIEI